MLLILEQTFYWWSLKAFNFVNFFGASTFAVKSHLDLNLARISVLVLDYTHSIYFIHFAQTITQLYLIKLLTNPSPLLLCNLS